MINQEELYIIVFESTHHAIAGEKIFKESNYKFDVIPTPREITHSCGLSIRFHKDKLNDVKMKMAEGNILIKGIYEIQKVDKDKIIHQVG